MKMKLLLGACTIVVLSGCSASLDRAGPPQSAQSADMSSYFAMRLAEGRRLLAAERPEKAIDAFRQASYDHQSAAEAFNGMGVAYAMMGRTDVARRMFERAFEANPADARSLRNLARLDGRDPRSGGDRPQLARVNATIPAPEAVTVAEPDSAAPQPTSRDLEEGRQLISEGRNLLAIERLRRAAEDDRVAADAYNAMGVAYSRLGNEGVARRMFERAMESRPDDPRFARNLARLEGRPLSTDPNPAAFAGVDPDAQDIQTERVIVQNGTLEKSAQEVMIRTSSIAPKRNIQIVTETKTVAATAVSIEDLDDRPDHPFPNYDYAEELVAIAPRVNGVPQLSAPLTQDWTYYLSLLEPASVDAPKPAVSTAPAGGDEPGLGGTGRAKAPMNFRQAWLESCSA